MSVGVLLPAIGLLIEPYILVWLGALLFLNLLRLNTSDLVATFKKPTQLTVLSAIKLVALPAGMYMLLHMLFTSLLLYQSCSFLASQQALARHSLLTS
jgi:bile acid:Na+ symporter, BASS family